MLFQKCPSNSNAQRAGRCKVIVHPDRKMVNTAGLFKRFLSIFDSSTPQTSLVRPDKTIERLLQTSGGRNELFDGEGILHKGERDIRTLKYFRASFSVPTFAQLILNSPNLGSRHTLTHISSGSAFIFMRRPWLTCWMLNWHCGSRHFHRSNTRSTCSHPPSETANY